MREKIEMEKSASSHLSDIEGCMNCTWQTRIVLAIFTTLISLPYSLFPNEEILVLSLAILLALHGYFWLSRGLKGSPLPEWNHSFWLISKCLAQIYWPSLVTNGYATGTFSPPDNTGHFLFTRPPYGCSVLFPLEWLNAWCPSRTAIDKPDLRTSEGNFIAEESGHVSEGSQLISHHIMASLLCSRLPGNRIPIVMVNHNKSILCPYGWLSQ